MMRESVAEFLLQGLGLSQEIAMTYPDNNEVHERALDYGGYVLEILFNMGAITYDGLMSPSTPGQKEAVKKIARSAASNPLVEYLLPLAAAVKASYCFGVEAFDLNNFQLATKAADAHLKVLETIPFLNNENSRIAYMKEAFPDIAPLYDEVFSLDFQTRLLRQLGGL